jgi:hypothetical protein
MGDPLFETLEETKKSLPHVEQMGVDVDGTIGREVSP